MTIEQLSTHNNVDQQVVAALYDMYYSMVSGTKPLDPESRKILYDNVWDLYE